MTFLMDESRIQNLSERSQPLPLSLGYIYLQKADILFPLKAVTFTEAGAQRGKTDFPVQAVMNN